MEGLFLSGFLCQHKVVLTIVTDLAHGVIKMGSSITFMLGVVVLMHGGESGGITQIAGAVSHSCNPTTYIKYCFIPASLG